MASLRKFTFHTAGFLLCAVLLSHQPAWAVSEAKPCPTEPTQDVPIKSGDVFAGANCIISPVTDIDSFRFGANANDVYRIALSLNGDAAPKSVCLELYGPRPARPKILTACSDPRFGGISVSADATLEKTGFHDIVVSEAGNDATAQYAISLQRLAPAPAERREIEFAVPVTDEINPPTDSDVFSFYAATNSTYRITAIIPAAGPDSVCFNVLGTDGVSIGSACVDTRFGGTTASLDVTPHRNGTHVMLVAELGYDSTVSYTLNVQCVLGPCPDRPKPPCRLNNVSTYNAGTLTMHFVVGTGLPDVHWNTWLIYQNNDRLLWSTAQPVSEPREVTRRVSFAPSGRVGILSTLTTPAGGIRCQSWTLVNTGGPPGIRSGEEPEIEDDEP